MLRNIDDFGECKLARIDRTFEIDFADMIAEIKFIFNQSDKAVFNGNFNHGATLDDFFESTRSLDSKRFSSETGLVLVM